MTGVGVIWSGRSLATRYALASGVVLALAALAIGAWVADRIEQSVVRNTANATALYMESVISPISQQLATEDRLSPGAQRALDEIFANTAIGQRVVSYKIWRADGTILEAEDEALIGQVFPLTDSLRRAFAGEVSAEFDDLGDAEDAGEQAMGLPLLEIYSPIREAWTGDVIAVAEFYELNEQLRSDLIQARRAAWGTVAGVVAVLGLALYAIVLGGSRTIDRQVVELQSLSARNQDLRLRVQNAASRAAAENDRALRRIGADLHDGPAQHLAYAALRLDALRDAAPGPVVEEVGAAVTEAMREVRAISRGLSLPDIAGRPPAEIVAAAVEAHRLRHGTEVALSVTGTEAPALDDAARIAVFRFVQEGLTNALRHAGGQGVEVDLATRTDGLTLTLRDRGPGLPEAPDGSGMGLAGLRDRVESLGGSFDARRRSGGGAEIVMQLEGSAG